MKITVIQTLVGFPSDLPLFIDGLKQTSDKKLGLVTITRSSKPNRQPKLIYQYAIYSGADSSYTLMFTKDNRPWEMFAVIDATGHTYNEVWNAFIKFLSDNNYLYPC